jgi:hypothetical protein
MCGWEWWGVLNPVGDHILQEFNTVPRVQMKKT